MRTFFRLFIGLLIPLSALFMVAATVYFKIEYNFTQAMRLGVLYGLFISLALSPLLALILLIMRRGKQPKKDIFSGVKKRQEQHKQQAKQSKVQDNDDTIKESSSTPVKISPSSNSVSENIMLLMDTTVAFEVLLYAISEQKLGKLTESDEVKGSIALKTDTSIIHMHIATLTKHTSQIQISANTDERETIHLIISYMKKKEYAFTQY